MITTLVGACLVMIVTSLALWLQIARNSGIQNAGALTVEDLNRQLAEIDLGLRQEKLTVSEADAARIALIEQIRGPAQRRAFGAAIIPVRKSTRVAIAGLVLAALAASTFLTGGDPAIGAAPADNEMPAPAGDDKDASALALLKTYTRSLGNEPSAPMSRPGDSLPDVETMIDRLATRLRANPGDSAGWRMLGWSYFHTERYDASVAAYAHAVELEPNNVEFKAAYEEAKARATGNRAASSTDMGTKATTFADVSSNQPKDAEAMPTAEREQAIRSMVESLASRLESSPVDVDGWTRLIRSRMVLSETEKAATALRKALDVFKNDTASREKIAALAKELGLAVN